LQKLKSVLKSKTNIMKNLEFILNDVLNKAMCQSGRIQKPDSNNIAEFVTQYLNTNKISLDCFEADEQNINIVSGEKWYEFVRDNRPELMGSFIVEYVESLRKNKRVVSKTSTKLTEKEFIDLALKIKLDNSFFPLNLPSVFELGLILLRDWPKFLNASWREAKDFAFEEYYKCLELSIKSNK